MTTDETDSLREFTGWGAVSRTAAAARTMVYIVITSSVVDGCH